MKKIKQLSFGDLPGVRGADFESNRCYVHGGQNAVGKRKKRRPVALKKSLHVIMKSSRARGGYSLRAFHTQPKIEKLIKHFARRFNIKIYQLVINFNHVHVVLKANQRDELQSFFRATAGQIAVLVLKAKKGEKRGRFWDWLTFSRIVEWGRAFQLAMNYVLQNDLEACGIIPFQPRVRKESRLD